MHLVIFRLYTKETELFKEDCTAHNTTPDTVLNKIVKDKPEKYLAELEHSAKSKQIT